MHLAWPGPATDVGNAAVIDGDHGDPVAGLPVAAGDTEVIEAPFKPGEEVGRSVQGQREQHHRQTHKGVGTPERASPPFCLFCSLAGQISPCRKCDWSCTLDKSPNIPAGVTA